MMSSNLERLMVVAKGLGDLNDKVAFVGGSVAELYADDPASTQIRPTEDVDCVIELATYHSLYDLEKDIRKKGFRNDTTPGAPICRWIYQGETVDIMPDENSILGFTNQWYKPAFSKRVIARLPDGSGVFVFPTLYYVATKIEAVRSRGGKDWRLSHDFEDLIYVLNYKSDIMEIFDTEKDEVLVNYLAEWAQEMLARLNGREEIECALPYGDVERSDYIFEIINHFSKSLK